MADPLKVLRTVIVTETGLADDRVLLYNTKWNLPQDDGMFIVLSIVGSQVIATGKQHVHDAQGLLEVQETILSDEIAVDVFSKAYEARDRRHEVIWALNSDTMQRACEVDALKVSDFPTDFRDLSFLEANARINRYHLTFRVSHLERREKLVEYYSTYSGYDLRIEP
jgi:hypothetical protein